MKYGPSGKRMNEEKILGPIAVASRHYTARQTEPAPDPIPILIFDTPQTRGRDLKLTIEQQGKGLIKVNGQPLSLVQPEILRFKVRQPSASC